jgi:hypothetical protein
MSAGPSVPTNMPGEASTDERVVCQATTEASGIRHCFGGPI